MSPPRREKIKTYEDIAVRHGLVGITKDRFIAYMRHRWGNPQDESIKCRVGYASEWAERFKYGQEYKASDREGKRVLKVIDSP